MLPNDCWKQSAAFVNLNKASSIATHVIASNDYNDDILRFVCKMINELSRHIYEPQNITKLKLLIAFSNLRIIFNRKAPKFMQFINRFTRLQEKHSFIQKISFSGFSMQLL